MSVVKRTWRGPFQRESRAGFVLSDCKSGGLEKIGNVCGVWRVMAGYLRKLEIVIQFGFADKKQNWK